MTKPADLAECARRTHDADEETRYQAVALLDPHGDGEFELLLESMGDASWRVRLAAVDRIVAAAQPARVLPRLLAALEAGANAAIRNAAAMALGRMGAPAVPGLLERIAAPNPETRTAAIEVLGDIQDRRAAQVLVDRLGDPDPNVRNTAAEALGKIGGGDAIAGLLAVLDREDLSLRLAALDALARLQSCAPVAVLRTLAGQKPLRRAVYRLMGYSDDAAAFELLAQGLCESSRAAREGALAGIGQQRIRKPRQALEALVRAVRGAGDRTPALADGCMAALGAEDHGVVTGALAVLGWLGDKRAAPAMARAAEDEALRPIVADALQWMGPGLGPALSETLRELSPAARTTVLAALARLGEASVLPALAEAAESPEEAVRSAAIDALGRLGDLRALPPLMKLLDNADPEPATAAASALVHFAASSAEGRVEILAACRRRCAAPRPPPALLRVLGQVGDAEDTAAIRAGFTAGRPSTRVAAARAFASMGDRGVFAGPPPPELFEALDDKLPAVRAEAARAIGAIAWAAGGAREPALALEPQLVRGLAAALRDEEPTVSAAAAQAVGRSGMRALAPILQELALDPHAASEAAGAAVRALADLGAADDAVLAHAAEHPDPEVVKEAVSAAARIPGSAARALLLKAASHARWDVRRAAARSLGVRKDPGLLGPLRELAAAEQDPLVAEAFLDALRTLESRGT